MNDDHLDLKTAAGRGSGVRRPARAAPAMRAQTLPAAPVRTPPMSPVRPRAAGAAGQVGADIADAADAARIAVAQGTAQASPVVPAGAGGPPKRVTRELPAEPQAAAPPEPAPPLAAGGRRITRELPVPPTAPVIERIFGILRAPPEWGETVKGAFSRKERELAAVFEELDSEEAGELFRRLSNPQPDDPVAASFARLVPERRGRLLGFLVTARRRAELAQAQRPPPTATEE
jgi:hypothetical protein